MFSSAVNCFLPHNMLIYALYMKWHKQLEKGFLMKREKKIWLIFQQPEPRFLKHKYGAERIQTKQFKLFLITFQGLGFDSFTIRTNATVFFTN